MVSVSAVIPARNDAQALPRAVQSILDQRDVSVAEIVIAVGPSTDDTAATAARLAVDHCSVQVIENPSGRTASGLNAAIEASTGEVVARVDARSVLPGDYLRHALEALERTGAGNVGAIQLPVGRTMTERAIAQAMRSWFGSGGAPYRRGAVARPVATAYLGVFRRSALDSVGGYDVEFIRNQDAELNARLNAAGHQVWLEPRMVVEYQPRSSLRGLAKQYSEYGTWRRRTIRRHPQSAQARQLAAPLVVVGCAGSLVGGALVHPLFFAVPVVYVGTMLLAGMNASGPLAERLLMSAALITMHSSWGTAFVIESVRSLRERRQPERGGISET